MKKRLLSLMLAFLLVMQATAGTASAADLVTDANAQNIGQIVRYSEVDASDKIFKLDVYIKGGIVGSAFGLSFQYDTTKMSLYNPTSKQVITADFLGVAAFEVAAHAFPSLGDQKIDDTNWGWAYFLTKALSPTNGTIETAIGLSTNTATIGSYWSELTNTKEGYDGYVLDTADDYLLYSVYFKGKDTVALKDITAKDFALVQPTVNAGAWNGLCAVIMYPPTNLPTKVEDYDVLFTGFPGDQPNNPPVAGGDRTGTAVVGSSDGLTPGTSYTANMSGWFTDDDGDELTYEKVSCDGAGTVTINGAQLTYTPAEGDVNQPVTLTVKANDGMADSTSNVTVTITVTQAADKDTDATLQSLSYAVGSGAQTAVSGFASGTESYTVTLPYTTADNASITLTGERTSEKATITSNDGVTLSNGQGSATITVQAENPNITKTYTVNFTVAAAPTVTLDANYTGGTSSSATVTKDGKYPSLPVPTRTGYTFAGWYTEKTGGEQKQAGDAYSGTADSTLYAHWTADGYSITYHLGDGVTDPGNPTAYTVETEDITLNNPTRVGYDFLGWSGTGLAGNENKSVMIPKGSTGDRTYTANWQIKTYTVTLTQGTGYTLAAESGSSSPVNHGGSYSFTLTLDEAYSQSEPVVKVNEVEINAVSGVYTISDITENQTVRVEGVTKNIYTITFQADGKTVTNGTKRVTHGGTLVLSDFPAVPEKTGYTGAWDVTADIENVTADQTVNAVYTAKQYTVTFEYQGATGGDTETSATVTYDSAYGELPAPTKTGSNFAGWYTEASGGTQVTKDTIVTTDSNHTLYARWSDKAVIALTNLNQTATYDGRTHAFNTANDKNAEGFTVKYRPQGSTDDNAWTADAPINAGTYEVQITRPEDGAYAAVNATGTLTIHKGQQATPNVSATAPAKIGETTTIGTGDSKLTTGMEYSTDNGTSWKPVTDDQAANGITGLADGMTVQIRYAATANLEASGSQSITISAFVPRKETTPSGSFEASTMLLSGVENGQQYSLDGQNWENITDTTVDLSNAGLTDGSTIRIKKPGNGETTLDSDVQSIPLTQAAKPTGTATDETGYQSEDGTITIIGDVSGKTYQISQDNGVTWNDATVGADGKITNLAPGDYAIRVKGNGTVLASEPSETLTVGEYIRSGSKEITGFKVTVGGKEYVGTIEGTNITLTVPYRSDVADLTPVVTHTGVKIAPDNTAQDFTSPVTYTVTAEDGTAQDYIVTITVALADQYTLTADTGMTHGTVTSEPKSPIAEDVEVMLTVIPDRGYQLKDSTLKAYKDGDQSTEVAIAGGKLTMPGYDVTVTAEFELVEYTITYDLADGALEAGVTNPDSYTVESGEFTLNNPTRSGYTFVGWTGTGLAGTVKTVTIPTGSIGNRTYTAVWSSNSGGGGGGGGGGSTTYYTLTFDANGGSSVGSVRRAAGTKITLNQTTEREGYVFTGWYLDEGLTEGTDSVTLTKNMTVYAGWQKEVEGPDNTGVSRWLNTSDHIKYLSGYPGNLFGPNDNMTRAEAAQMFYNLLLDQNVPITIQFEDVEAGAWYAKAVHTLASLGIIKGVGDHQFAPERAITRAEFTTIAMRFAKLDTGGENIFPDVSEDAWYYDYVVGSIQYGWIAGYPDGTFGPNNTITRAEVTAIVNRMLSRSSDVGFINSHVDSLARFGDLSKSHWAYYEIMEATNAHDYRRSGGVESWTKLD